MPILKRNIAIQTCQKILSRVKNSFRGKYHLYTGEHLHWVQLFLRLEGSIIPNIIPWVIFFGIYGFLISFLHFYGVPIGFSQGNRVITNAILSFNIGLSLLLVFRTNTAHERFWEGRKLWGALVNTSRNLTQEIYVAVKERSPRDKLQKEAILRLVVAFAIAMKSHLRTESLDEQLVSLMSEDYYRKLKAVNHPLLQISFWIRDYLQYQYEHNCLNIYQLNSLHKQVDNLVDILGGCERILKTPLPLIYAILLRQLVILYCLVIPLEIVANLTWWTGLIVALVGFTLLSIEQIGSEIEEPFGHDPNDLPLDIICNTIHRNVEELITIAPNNCHIAIR
jgi:ion channel-forming bestrophin family protein